MNVNLRAREREPKRLLDRLSNVPKEIMVTGWETWGFKNKIFLKLIIQDFLEIKQFKPTVLTPSGQRLLFTFTLIALMSDERGLNERVKVNIFSHLSPL